MSDDLCPNCEHPFGIEVERLRAERDDLQVLLRGRTAEFQAEIERLEAARKQLLDAARGYMDMVVEERDNNGRLRGEIECLHGKMRRLGLDHLTTLSELQDAAAETARLQAERDAERALADQMAEALRAAASHVKRSLVEDPGTWSVIVHALKTYKEIRNEH